MNKQVILYFQIHQPYRINIHNPDTATTINDWFVGLEAGKNNLDMRNKTIFESVSQKCYLPTTKFWLNFINKHPNFTLNLSFSGTFLEQCLDYPEIGNVVLSQFKELVNTGQVEVLGETYYHSLATQMGGTEFETQVKLHDDLIFKLFAKKPVSFRNTELIYSDLVGAEVAELGYKIEFFENPDWSNNLQTKPNSEIYLSNSNPNLLLIPRDHLASDALIYINSSPDRLVKAIQESSKKLILLGTDYEFLGEHFEDSAKTTTILGTDLEKLMSSGVEFIKSSSILENQDLWANAATYLAKDYTSWAHTEKDISVWRGNEMQEKAFASLMDLINLATTNYPKYLPYIRRLSTSCHFYFLGQKEGEDAEFVQLFSPYNNTAEALKIFTTTIDQIKQYILNNG